MVGCLLDFDLCCFYFEFYWIYYSYLWNIDYEFWDEI